MPARWSEAGTAAAQAAAERRRPPLGAVLLRQGGRARRRSPVAGSLPASCRSSKRVRHEGAACASRHAACLPCRGSAPAVIRGGVRQNASLALAAGRAAEQRNARGLPSCREGPILGACRRTLLKCRQSAKLHATPRPSRSRRCRCRAGAPLRSRSAGAAGSPSALSRAAGPSLVRRSRKAFGSEAACRASSDRRHGAARHETAGRGVRRRRGAVPRYRRRRAGAEPSTAARLQPRPRRLSRPVPRQSLAAPFAPDHRHPSAVAHLHPC